MGVWTLLPADKAAAPEAVGVADVEGALVAVCTHLAKSRHASKDRINLEALEEHCGKKYAQHLQVPEALFGSLRALLGAVPFVLLPPDADAAEDAVVLLADWHGALKGLPPNERANFLCTAAGTTFKVRGDVFVGRLKVGAGGLSLGADAPPDMLTARGWLEAAQAANGDGSGCQRKGTPAAGLAHLLGRMVSGAVAVVRAKGGAGQPVAEQGAPPEPEAELEGLGKVRWEDAEDAVTVTVRVPAGTRPAHVKCEIKAGRLLLQVSTLSATPIVDGELFQTVHDSSWGLEDAGAARLLTLELEKPKPMRWIMLTRE